MAHIGVGIDCYILDAVVPATTPQIKEDQHLFNLQLWYFHRKQLF